MSSIQSPLLATVVLGCIVSLVSRWLFQYWQFNRKYKLPVRIPGIPFLGNLLQIPPEMQGRWAKKMAEKYGEMYTCKFGNSKWVFLNSSRTVNDLLVKRTAIYSSRPEFPFTQDIMSRGARVVLMPYNDRWKMIRKIMHNVLMARQQDVFKPFQDLESKSLLWDYLQKPDRWWSANGRYSNSVIMSILFGRRSRLDNPEVAELFETMDLFTLNQQPGANIVQGFPILAKLPERLQWWRLRVQLCEERIKQGTQRECLFTDFLKSEEIKKMDETQKLFTFDSLMEAGSDTTRATLGQIIAGAATSPDWVLRAREHLDAVCGRNAERLPEWEDRPRLRYISAVVKQGFRWRPVTAEIGAPHMLTKDDEYEGYRFPAEPTRFWPERFLDGDEENMTKGHFTFGPGRRICVGWKVGEMSLWIAVARLIYCFDFTEISEQPINTMAIPQATNGKPQFAVKVTPRSPAHPALIRRDCETATKVEY